MNGKHLIDGQHRLNAVIKAGKPIQSLIVRGVSSDAFDTIDTGKNRSGGDVLALAGESYASGLAATLGYIHRYQTGKMLHRQRTSNTELLNLLEKHPGARTSVKHCHDRTNKLVGPSVLSACHYLFSQIDTEAAYKFIEDLNVGANLASTDPVFVLREKLYQNKAKIQGKLRPSSIMALIIKAWNMRRVGAPCKSLKSLRFAPMGKKPESFPVVR